MATYRVTHSERHEFKKKDKERRILLRKSKMIKEIKEDNKVVNPTRYTGIIKAGQDDGIRNQNFC